MLARSYRLVEQQGMARARSLYDMGVWSITTRDEYVSFLQSKKNLSKASIHSYCWRLETLFRALMTGKQKQGNLDRGQIRQLIEHNLEEAERLVAQDDRRSHWCLLKEFLELPSAPLCAGERGRDEQLLDSVRGVGEDEVRLPVHTLENEANKHKSISPNSFRKRNGMMAASKGKHENKVWDMELKKDYRTWLRERGVKERTCGSYCTFVHNLLRALADARKPVPYRSHRQQTTTIPITLLPTFPQSRLSHEEGKEERKREQQEEPSVLAMQDQEHHQQQISYQQPRAGQRECLHEGLQSGNAILLLASHEDSAIGDAYCYRGDRSGQEASEDNLRVAEDNEVVAMEGGEAGIVAPRREGLNRGELIELLDEQQEEAQRIVRQSKKNRYLRSFREFLGMSNHDDHIVKNSRQWTDRVGGAYKKWIGAGGANCPHARTRGYVGAARSILRVIKRKGWVQEAFGGPPLTSADICLAIEAHKEELQQICDKADDECLQAFCRYLRRPENKGDGEEEEEKDFHSSPAVSSLGIGAEDDEAAEDMGDHKIGTNPPTAVKGLHELTSTKARIHRPLKSDAGIGHMNRVVQSSEHPARCGAEEETVDNQQHEWPIFNSVGHKRKRPDTTRERGMEHRIRSLTLDLECKTRERNAALARIHALELEIQHLRDRFLSTSTPPVSAVQEGPTECQQQHTRGVEMILNHPGDTEQENIGAPGAAITHSVPGHTCGEREGGICADDRVVETNAEDEAVSFRNKMGREGERAEGDPGFLLLEADAHSNWQRRDQYDQLQRRQSVALPRAGVDLTDGKPQEEDKRQRCVFRHHVQHIEVHDQRNACDHQDMHLDDGEDQDHHLRIVGERETENLQHLHDASFACSLGLREMGEGKGDGVESRDCVGHNSRMHTIATLDLASDITERAGVEENHTIRQGW